MIKYENGKYIEMTEQEVEQFELERELHRKSQEKAEKDHQDKKEKEIHDYLVKIGIISKEV